MTQAGRVPGLVRYAIAFAAASMLLFALGSERAWGVEGCRPIAVPAAAPVGAGSCPGVRPGAVAVSDVGACTLNFLFRGTDGRRYIGTAGHCALEEEAEDRIWARRSGPGATDAAGARIGRFAYAHFRGDRDFALIRLRRRVEAKASLCHFGGPTGINAARTALPTVLNFFGNGLLAGELLPARSAIAPGMPSSEHVYAEGVAAPGDSGSAVIAADGKAIGALVTLGVHASLTAASGVDAGLIGISRLAPRISDAERALRTDLTLVTAPLK